MLGRCCSSRKHVRPQTIDQLPLNVPQRLLHVLQHCTRFAEICCDRRVLEPRRMTRQYVRAQQQAAAFQRMRSHFDLIELLFLKAFPYELQRLPCIGQILAIERGEADGVGCHGQSKLVEVRGSEGCLFHRHWALPFARLRTSIGKHSRPLTSRPRSRFCDRALHKIAV